MMTHGDFQWMLVLAECLTSTADSRTREAEELNACGNEAAAVEKLEQSNTLLRQALDLRGKIVESPSYEQWRTLSLAADVQLTSEFVDRMAAAPAIKRGITLEDLNDLRAVEVSAMVVADAASPDKSLVSGKSPAKKSPRKSKNALIVKFAERRLEKGEKYAAITAEWNDSHQNDQRSQDAIERAVRRARKADKGGHVI